MKILKILLILLFSTNISLGQSQKKIGRCNVIGEYNDFFVSGGEPNFWCVGRFAFSKLECKNNSNTTDCLDLLEKTRFTYYKNFTQTATYQLNNKVLEAIETYSIILKTTKNEKQIALASIVGLFKNPTKSNEFFYEISDNPEHNSSNESFKISYYTDDENLSTVFSKKGVIEKIHYKYDDINIYEKREFFNPIKSKEIPYKVQTFNVDGGLESEIENNKITFYPDPKYANEDYIDGFNQGNFKPYSRDFINGDETGPYKIYSLNGNLRFERKELNATEYTETTYYKNGNVYEVRENASIGNGEVHLMVHRDHVLQYESFENSNYENIKYEKDNILISDFELLDIDYDIPYFNDVKEIFKKTTYDSPDQENPKKEFFYLDGQLLGYCYEFDNEIKGEFKVFYPNGNTCVEGIVERGKVKVYDINGKKIKKNN